MGKKGAIFFVEYGDIRKTHNIPDSLQRLFDSKDEDEGVAITVCLAFTEQKGWLITYKNAKGNGKYAYENIPEKLLEFMESKKTKARDIYMYETMRFSIGQGDAFFASVCTHDGSTRYRWDNLSEVTNEWAQLLLARTEGNGGRRNIYTMALGYHENHVLYQRIRGGDNPGWSFNLDEDKHAWIKHLIDKRRGDLREDYIALNPFDRRNYYLVSRECNAYWNLRLNCIELVKEVNQKIKADKEEERERSRSRKIRRFMQRLGCCGKPKPRKIADDELEPPAEEEPEPKDDEEPGQEGETDLEPSADPLPA